MILDKNLLKDLLGCKTNNEDMCKYSMLILKYIITLNDNKITSTEQCKIFFRNEKNNKADLHPYVISYYYNLGRYHGSIYIKEPFYDNRLLISFDNYYRKNNCTVNVSSKTYTDIIEEFIPKLYGKTFEAHFINNLKDLMVHLKKSNNTIIYSNIYFCLINTINEPVESKNFNVYDSILYLFQRDILNLLSNIIYNFFIKKIFKDENELYKHYYPIYKNLNTIYKKLLLFNDNKNAQLNAIRLNKKESEFMNFFVPLIDVSIINNVLYYDSNNQVQISSNKINESILKDVYIRGFKSFKSSESYDDNDDY